jgi:hypothetical protein
MDENTVYILENDLEKKEITLTLPEGRNEITLSEKWAIMLLEQLTNHIQEWR